MMDLSVNFNSF